MDVFAALADPIRRDLLHRVGRQACRVVDLAGEHDVSRPAISRHLRILAEAGLVVADDRGRERWYRLEAGPLTTVRAVLDELDAPARRPPVTGRHLDALATEVHRAGRDRRRATATAPTTGGDASTTTTPGSVRGESEERTA